MKNPQVESSDSKSFYSVDEINRRPEESTNNIPVIGNNINTET